MSEYNSDAIDKVNAGCSGETGDYGLSRENGDTDYSEGTEIRIIRRERRDGLDGENGDHGLSGENGETD